MMLPFPGSIIALAAISLQTAGGGINGRVFDMVKRVVYKSQDGGLSWTAIWRGENLARCVIIDPENVNILIFRQVYLTGKRQTLITPTIMPEAREA